MMTNDLRQRALARIKMPDFQLSHGTLLSSVPRGTVDGSGGRIGQSGQMGREGRTGQAGQDDEAFIAEREAIVWSGGAGVPLRYAMTFARLNHVRPEGLSEARWRQLIDDAGRWLDAFGKRADGLGIKAETIFQTGGPIDRINGGAVAWGIDND